MKKVTTAKERLQIEIRELSIRSIALNCKLEGPIDNKISKIQYKLLRKQLKQQHALLSTLKERLEKW